MTGYISQDVYNTLRQHILNNGGVFSDWYCGITNNVQRRLYEEHRLPANGLGFAFECVNKASAEAVETALLNNQCAGGQGGGNEDSVHVYIYKMTPYTVQ